MGLTEHDLRILRQADIIAFRTEGATHEILATLSYQNPNNQTGLDHEHQIPVYGYVTVSAFPLDTDIAQTATTTNARAFTMVPAGILTRTWTDLLQLGDEPVLAWWANNTPRDLRRMGLTYDELHLSIFRDRQERCRFYIAASVCRADVADRMIRLGLD